MPARTSVKVIRPRDSTYLRVTKPSTTKASASPRTMAARKAPRWTCTYVHMNIYGTMAYERVVAIMVSPMILLVPRMAEHLPRGTWRLGTSTLERHLGQRSQPLKNSRARIGYLDHDNEAYLAVVIGGPRVKSRSTLRFAVAFSSNGFSPLQAPHYRAAAAQIAALHCAPIQ